MRQRRRRTRQSPRTRQPPGARRRAEPASPRPRRCPAVLDVLQAGSGFLRVEDGDDVYVSPAQIRRCELRAGDEVARTAATRAPQRAPPLARARRDGQRPRRRAARGAPALLGPDAGAPDRAAADARRRSSLGRRTERARAWRSRVRPARAARGCWAQIVEAARQGLGADALDRARGCPARGAGRLAQERRGRRLRWQLRPAQRRPGPGGRAGRGAREAGGRARRGRRRGRRLAGVDAARGGAADLRCGAQGRGGRIAHGVRHHRQRRGPPAPGQHAHRARLAGPGRLAAGVGLRARAPSAPT